MRILFIGDIVGKPGRDLLRKGLRSLVDSLTASSS
jgi:calcineurin-like phosphoesterase